MITYGELVKTVIALKDLGFTTEQPVSYSYILNRILENNTIELNEILDLASYIQGRLYSRIKSDEYALDVCAERMMYVSKYLSGTMYEGQSKPTKQDKIQLKNVNSAIDIIKGAKY